MLAQTFNVNWKEILYLHLQKVHSKSTMKLTENSNKMATELPFSLKREKTLMPQDFHLHKPKFMTAENAAYINKDVERKSEYMEENDEELVKEEINMKSDTEMTENNNLMLNKTEDLKEENEDFKDENQQPDRKYNTTPTDLFNPESQSVNVIDDDSRSEDDKIRNRQEYDRYTTYTEQGPNALFELESISQHVPIDDSIQNLLDNRSGSFHSNQAGNITPRDLNFHDLMEPLEGLASPRHVTHDTLLERKYPVLPSIGRKAPTTDVSDSQSFRSSTLNQLDYTRDKIEQDADFFADYRLNTSIVKVTPRQNPLPPIKSSNTSSPRQ